MKYSSVTQFSQCRTGENNISVGNQTHPQSTTEAVCLHCVKEKFLSKRRSVTCYNLLTYLQTDKLILMLHCCVFKGFDVGK